jgi:hypothetical protein
VLNLGLFDHNRNRSLAAAHFVDPFFFTKHSQALSYRLEGIGGDLDDVLNALQVQQETVQAGPNYRAPSSWPAFISEGLPLSPIELKRPSFRCSARSWMLRSAARASSRLWADFAGTSRAISLPWRVMVISSPQLDLVE